MKVKEIFAEDKVYDEDNHPTLANQAVAYMVLNGILCSTASLVYVHDHGQWDVLGDPTEGALLFLAQKLGLVPEMVRRQWRLLKEAPFDSVNKRMTVVVQKGSQIISFSKGSPESILSISQKILRGRREEDLTQNERKKIEEQVGNWASKGLRVLAFAYKMAGPDSNITIEQYNNNLVFLGMVAIHDAPRPEVVEAVNKAKEAGIKIVMITGDNEKTAEAIGVTTGIIKEGDEILTGTQLENYSEEDLLKILPKAAIFARTNPFQKHQIVRLYQKLGEIVAVTGDGVNDAIALKQADVGVAMGQVGTDVARETADMVITDDNFASIINAVEEGRNIIKNLKNAIQYLLSCNIGEAISLVAGLILGLPNLFYPIQFLYINLITDGLPAISLSFSPRNAQLMKARPEKELVLLKTPEKKYIFFVGLFSSILVLASYFLFADEVGKTAAFSVLTLIQSFVFIDLWLTHQSIHKNLKHLISPIFVSAFIIPFILQYFNIRFSFMANIFRVTAVSFITYVQFIFVAGLVFVGIKLIKKLCVNLYHPRG